MCFIWMNFFLYLFIRKKMDEYRMARSVLMAEVSGERIRGRPRLGWMDGVKVALGNRGMTVEAARQCAKDRKRWSPGTYVTEWVSHRHFCSALCSFGPPSRALVWWLSPGEGWGAVNDSVGINGKKGANTEYQGADIKYMG